MPLTTVRGPPRGDLPPPPRRATPRTTHAPRVLTPAQPRPQQVGSEPGPRPPASETGGRRRAVPNLRSPHHNSTRRPLNGRLTTTATARWSHRTVAGPGRQHHPRPGRTGCPLQGQATGEGERLARDAPRDSQRTPPPPLSGRAAGRGCAPQPRPFSQRPTPRRATPGRESTRCGIGGTPVT